MHRPLSAIGEDAEPLRIDVPITQFRQTFDRVLRNQPFEFDVQIGNLRLTASGQPRCFHFVRDGLAASARTGDKIAFVPDLAEWECFLPVSDAELDALRYLPANDWIIRSSGVPVKREYVPIGVWFSLRFGALSFDLRYQLPLDLSDWPFRLTLLRDGWRIEQVCLFRPLIYFTAFRSPAVLEQLELSLRSLVDVGGYDGDILIMTDRPHDETMGGLVGLEPARIALFNTEPADFVGYATAKYAILDIARAEQFQLVMFVDPDIIFDADVTPILSTVARSDRLCAPLEPFSPLRTAPSVGSGLLQLDGFSPRFAAGFNCGTIGIPNLAAHAATLRLIRTIIGNRIDAFGRDNLGWVDQEVANYVSFRLADFDTAAITPFCRFGGWPDTETDTSGRNGLVHFWPAPSSENKVAAMRAYRERPDKLTPGISPSTS